MDIKDTKLSEIKFPKEVFKIRSWQNESHRQILAEQTVFYSPINSFEDKLDGKIKKDFSSYTDEDLFLKYLDSSYRTYPFYTVKQHIQFATEWTKKSPFKDKQLYDKLEQDYFKLLDEKYGILCLSLKNDNKLMWEKYGDNHHGFSVGFSAKQIYAQLGGFIGYVKYFDSLPVINREDSSEIEAYKQIFYKERKWKFESEYRSVVLMDIIKLKNYHSRCIKLKKECLTSVTFGYAMPEIDRKEIRSICRKESLKVNFREIVINGKILRVKDLPSH